VSFVLASIRAAHHRPLPRVTGPIVIETFTATAEAQGLPAATLTDNGMVYATRLAGAQQAGTPSPTGSNNYWLT
jgi:hypothetical protein